MRTSVHRLVGLVLLAACGVNSDGEADSRDDSVSISSDRKSDAAGYAEGSAEAIGILKVANQTVAVDLKAKVGLTSRAVSGILAARPFATLKVLDQVPYVGTSTFEKLLTYAQSNGEVGAQPSAPAPTSPIRPGLYRELDIYGAPEPSYFPPILVDVIPPRTGTSTWTVNVYQMSSDGCATLGANGGGALWGTSDGRAEKICAADGSCSFKFDGLGSYGREVYLANADLPNQIAITHHPIASSSWDDQEEESFEWVRDIASGDRRCDCPVDPSSPAPTSSYQGPAICDASCQGEPTPFGFESPLVLSFENALIQFSGKPVDFDFYADGSHPLLDWLLPPAGLLALDLNQNGTIDTGRELFGTSTLLGATGQAAKNGFDALAQYDANGDGQIDAQDPIYPQLLVWTDTNIDGVSQATELVDAETAGVKSISLHYAQEAHDPNSHASYVDSFASFSYQPRICAGVTRQVSDVWFAMEPKK